MENRFYIGQDVVCIKSDAYTPIIEGDVYKVLGLREGFCGCAPVLVNVGFLDFSPTMGCKKCRASSDLPDNVRWLNANRFKPLDELTNIEELKEVLEQPLFA